MWLFVHLFFIFYASAKCAWHPIKRASNHSVVKIFFALPYSNNEESERLFQSVSDPESPSYRKFLSPDEVFALVTPKDKGRAVVDQFLQASFPGIQTKWSSWGQSVHFQLTVQEVEDMLNTRCFVYEYKCGPHVLRSTIRTLHQSFPEFELSEHLAYIGGVTQFPFLHRHPKTKVQLSPEINETELSFAELRNSFSLAPLSNSFTPVQAIGDNKKVYFVVTVVCPDETVLMGSSTCRDGSRLKSVLIRSSHGSDPQRSTEYPAINCGLYSNLYQCIFIRDLEDNWVRVAFGFDLQFDSGLTYSYNLQHFVVGTNEKFPKWVKRFYSVPADLQATNATSYQAIGALTLKDSAGTGFYSSADLSKAYSVFGVSQANVDLVDFKGTVNDPTHPDVETSLDIQWITAMAPGARSSVWHTPPGADESIEVLLSQIQAAAKLQQAPYVVSLSYGGAEAGQSPAMLQQQEAGFRSLGMMGITVLVASGDTGAYWEDDCDRFLPVYPASSLYVTSVGATQLVVQNLHNSCKVEESVCSVQTGASITSGGGFSAVFARPSWQNDAVEEYLRGELPDMDYDKQKRAYPDISFLGRSFTIVHQLQQITLDGTSASAPALAGLVTLINDVRFSKGLGPLGFLNPTLYKIQKEKPEAFHDVLVGYNGCTRTECCKQGFSARAGWDAATGLGSPVFAEFAAALGAPVNGSWEPIEFPDDLDCASPIIQPNKVNPWESTKVWVIVVALLVAAVGVAVIVGVWRYKQRRRQVSVNLQEDLVA